MESSFDASELAGCLSDVAKTNTDFWTQCSNLPVRPREITPAGVTSPVARTSNLPLLPTPKPLQAEKRPRDTEVMDPLKGQRVVVLRLPHDTLREDLTRLFGPYSVEYIDLLSHSPGNAVVGLTSAEEASRAVRELSGKLLQGSSISLLTEERVTGVSFIEGGQLALSKMQRALDENRPSKRIRSDQMAESLIAEQHAEQTTHRAEPQAKKKAKGFKDIEFLIGGLSPDAKAYQVKAFLDTHHISCTSSPQKIIRRNEELGFYTSIKLLNNEQSIADMQRLSGQNLNGNEIKILLVDSVAAMNRYGQVPEYQSRNEAELATQRTIAEGRRVCVSNLKHATTEDDLRDYFKSYAVEAITIPPFRPSEGYLAFIDFQSASELNNAHSDLRVRQDAGDLLPVYRSAPNVWLRNDKIIFTIWNKEKEEERKLQAPSTREERHCNRGAFTHYTLRIADLPLNTTKADVRRLFPEIRFSTIMVKPSTSTNSPASYAIAEATMNVNQEKAMKSFKPRNFQGYSVTIAIADSKENHSDSTTGPDVAPRMSLDDPNDNGKGSIRMKIPAVSSNEKARSNILDPQALPEHAAKKPRSEEPINAKTRSDMMTDIVLPDTAPQNLSSDKVFTKAVPDDESKALDRKTLREWWIRERGIWLDI